MAAHAWLRGSVVTSVLNEYERLGGDSPSLLAHYGLTQRILADPQANVPLAKYVAMYEEMAGRLADPLLGARLGFATRPIDLGPAGMVMARSRSVYAALERLTRFLTSFQPGTHASLTESDGLLLWAYRIRDPEIWPRRQDAEYTMSSLVRLIRSAFMRDWQPLLVQFEHAPASADSARALEHLLGGCPIRFEAASNGLMLPSDEAQRNFRDEDPDLIAVLERYLADLTSADASHASWTDKVMSLVTTYLGQQPVTLTRLAADLAIAPRSLQRYLASEGVSLRQLLRTYRQEIADQHFQAGTLRLGNLAEALGYADGTTFWRAHRNWTGQSPSAMLKGRAGRLSNDQKRSKR